MTSSTSPAPDSALLHSGESSLTYDDLKTQFPLVLDVRSDWGDSAHPVDTPIETWFQTDSTALADASTLPKIIGRTYFLKHGKPIEMIDVKSYLRKTRNGTAETPVPLNQLGQLVSDAVQALAPAPASNRERKKSPYLTFIDLQAQFPHLFEADSRGRLKINTRKTAVEAWFETTKTSLVDPAALTKIIGRAFYLKHRKLIHTGFIRAHLNGSGAKPVPLNELSKLVSEAVAALVKGPKVKPDPRPDHVGAERPVYMVPSIFKPSRRNRNRIVHDRDLDLVNRTSSDALVSVARGRLTPLKGTAPEKAK